MASPLAISANTCFSIFFSIRSIDRSLSFLQIGLVLSSPFLTICSNGGSFGGDDNILYTGCVRVLNSLKFDLALLRH